MTRGDTGHAAAVTAVARTAVSGSSAAVGYVCIEFTDFALEPGSGFARASAEVSVRMLVEHSRSGVSERWVVRAVLDFARRSGAPTGEKWAIAAVRRETVAARTVSEALPSLGSEPAIFAAATEPVTGEALDDVFTLLRYTFDPAVPEAELEECRRAALQAVVDEHTALLDS